MLLTSGTPPHPPLRGEESGAECSGSFLPSSSEGEGLGEGVLMLLTSGTPPPPSPTRGGVRSIRSGSPPPPRGRGWGRGF